MRALFMTLEQLLHRHRFALLWVGFCAVCVIAFAQNWGYHVIADTPSYAVGDLLLNYAGGIARRGLLGQVAVFLADSFGGLPWIWAWAIGCALTGVLFAFGMRLFRALPDDPVFVPLILAPWGLLFYVYDEGAALRKEMMAYLALVLILQAMRAQTSWRAACWVASGAALFLTALFAHETVALTGPAQVLAVLLVAQKWPELRRGLILLVVAVVTSTAAIVAYLYLLPPPDLEAICAATRAGCHASALWLGRGIAENIAFTLENRGWADIVTFIGVAALCAVPMLGVRVLNASRWHSIAAVSVVIAFVLPLFVFAMDWGRWVHMAVFPLCLVALAGVPGGFVRYHRVLPVWASVFYVASWNLMHAQSGLQLRALLMVPVLVGLVLLHKFWSSRRAE